jgi:hypothetical protein
MGINVTNEPAGDSDLIVLVEDDGLRPILEAVLSSEVRVDLVFGQGWQQLYQRYEVLLQRGISPKRILPILDADTLGEKGPRSTIATNPNTFRFHRDLEFSFAGWPGLELAQALASETEIFGPSDSPRALAKWAEVVNVSRGPAAQGMTNVMTSIQATVETTLERNSQDPTVFRMPSKVDLAARLAEICTASDRFPDEIMKIVWRIANILEWPVGRATRRNQAIGRHALDAPTISGELIVCSDNSLAKSIDLESGELADMPYTAGLQSATWSGDGEWIAGNWWEREGNGYRVRIWLARRNDLVNPVFLSPGTNAHLLCLCHDDLNLLAYVPGGGVFALDGENPTWEKRCEPDQAWRNLPFIRSHCISSKNYFARVSESHDACRPIQIWRRIGAEKPIAEVPGVMDARLGIAWSQAGNRLAFVDRDQWGRASICLWTLGEERTRFITPWMEGIQCVAWSPDDRYIAFCRGNDVCIVSAELANPAVRPVLKVATLSNPLLMCRAWRKSDARE